MRRILLACLCIFATAASASDKTDTAQRNSELTQGNVQLTMKVGETTKFDVLEAFGSPNITTRDGSGLEVWSYQRHATVSKSTDKTSFWTILLAGGASKASGFSQTMRTMTLIIKFDSRDIVTDFRSRTSDF